MTEAAAAPKPEASADPQQGLEIRDHILKPVLDRLNPGRGSQIPAALVSGDTRIEVPSWLREVMLKPDPEQEAWILAATEGFAFWVKRRLTLPRSRGEQKAPPALADSVRGSLTTDAAIGLALQVELQRGINRLVCGGHHQMAKQLSELSNGIDQELKALETLLGGIPFQKATKLSEKLVRPEEQAPLLEESEEEAPRQFKKASPRVHMISSQEVKRSRRPMILGIIFGVCVVGWITFLLTRPQRVEHPILTSSDLIGVRALDSVTARPPSLFVQMDADIWRRMKIEDRRQALEKMGSVAAQAGYSGVFAHTPEGAAVGQWLRKSGIQLIQPSSQGS